MVEGVFKQQGVKKMSEQKFKLSDDQNTLVVVSGQFEGQYEATGQDGCASCSFWVNEICELKTFSTCAWAARKDEKSIIWIKAESKQDNKKATAIFSDNETVLKISGHSKHDGTYEARENDGCWGCFFYQCTFDSMLGGRKCISSHRQDNKSIIWIKKENTEMTEAPAPALQHRHFDLIVAWAKNPTQPLWFWSAGEWARVITGSPSWTGNHYAIGEKPTMPPVKMVKYDGGSIEFPKPANVQLERNKQFWAATIYGATPDYWTGHSSDWDLLDVGLIQLTSEGAEKQSDALVELLRNHAQKWG